MKPLKNSTSLLRNKGVCEILYFFLAAFLLMLFVPNIIWACKAKPAGYDEVAKKENKLLLLLERWPRPTIYFFLGAVAGAVAMALFSVPSNYFITYPAYVKFYHMPLEAILGMYQAILPSANSLIKCLVIFNMPFTLVKGLLDALICMLIYKPLSPILHGRK